MIGQLQNNFRKILASTTLVTAMSVSSYSFAETVVGRLIASDWFVIVKEEGGVKTIVHTHEPPNWEFSEPVYFDVNFTNETLDNSYLYILAASRPGGQDGFLGGQLNGDKKITSGSSAITALNSNWTDVHLPNLEVIKEITNGDLGGTFGPTRQAKAIGEFSYGSIEHNSDVPGIWSQQSGDDGSVVAFRIPYTALFDVISDKGSDTESNGNDTDSSTETPGDDAAMEDYIDGLQDIIKEHEANIRDLEAELSKETKRADSTFALLEQRDETIAVLSTNPTATTTLKLLEKQKKEIADLKAKIKTLETDGPAPISPALLWSVITLGLGGLFGFFLARRRKPSSPLQIEKLQTNKNHQPLMQKTAKTWPDISLPAGEARGMMPRVDMPIPPRNVQIDYSQKSGFISSSVLVPEKKDNEIVLVEKKYPEERPNYHEPYIVINKWHGMALPGSAMVAGQALLPDPILHLQTAYNAVGRIGFAQSGKAIGEDRNLGTGILIADQYIITNGHVWDTHSDMFKEETELGIEFHGEKNSAKSDFYEFDKDAQPAFIPETDAIILKLKRKVPRSKRKPIHFSNIPTKDMKNREVIVVGYPSEPEDISEEEIKAMGHDDIFNVKRYSEGKLMLHPSDDDQDMLIETRTSGSYSTPPKETISAICHTASTLEGSSGSAVLCKETGELLALHFGYDMFFDYMDDDFNFIAKTNLAIPGLFLSDIVTFITSELEKAA